MRPKPKYLVDDFDQKIAVQIDIDTFNKIEEILENYALYKLMETDENDEVLDLKQAKEYYSSLSENE